jgi:L-Ala-D/L-Glu epimerase
MTRRLSIDVDAFPIRGSFRIARGAKAEARVVVATVSDGGATGHGECVPYARYGETVDGVVAALEGLRPAVENGLDRHQLLTALPAGAARNALDCALWDFEAKQGRTPAWRLAGLDAAPDPLTTLFTISLGTPDSMAAAAACAADRPWLKVKLGGDGDLDRLQAVRQAAPGARLVVDANEGWRLDQLTAYAPALAAAGVRLVEQPLPAGQDDALAGLALPVPLAADESFHGIDDIDRLAGRYQVLNLKLDKTGGLTAALTIRERARAAGFGIMVGCMVGSSLSMAPAVLLAQDADYVDLDGPLLLATDRAPGLTYDGSLLYPPSPALWG